MCSWGEGVQWCWCECGVCVIIWQVLRQSVTDCLRLGSRYGAAIAASALWRSRNAAGAALAQPLAQLRCRWNNGWRNAGAALMPPALHRRSHATWRMHAHAATRIVHERHWHMHGARHRQLHDAGSRWRSCDAVGAGRCMAGAGRSTAGACMVHSVCMTGA